MPSLTKTNGSKFQLPALDLKFGSLTEGTNIPPPLPSPVQEDAPAHAHAHDHTHAQATTVDGLVKSAATNNGTQTTPEVQRNGLKSPTDRPPPGSPLFSKADSMFPRPVSQSNASIATDGHPKRASAWFRRLRGSDGFESKRSSKILTSSENTRPLSVQAPKPSGPPPPTIPEFKSLGSKVDFGDDSGSLGSDMFKDIK